MLNIQDFTFPSSDGATALHGRLWCDDTQAPRAVLQIAHGVSEYIARYDRFARFLVEKGFAVVGHDHLGHGQSLPEGGTAIYFADENGWTKAVDDVAALSRKMKADFPGVPLFLLGHSMGSFLTRSFLIRYPGVVDGAIVMGTGWQAPVMIQGGLLVAGLEAKRHGRRAVSPLVNNLAFGGYNKPFRPNRTGYDWLSVDEENVDRYVADPKCGEDATIGLFLDMLEGFRFNQNVENLKRMDKDTPVLFVSGEKDPVGSMGKGVEKCRDAFKSAGVKDVDLILYSGLRHEILNEKSQQKMVDHDILMWLEAHL